MSLQKALKFVLRHEGLWSDDPADPGGATMRGITQRVYDAYRTRMNRDLRSVALISDDEVEDIYGSEYYVPIGGDKLPEPLDLVCFDSAVNCGVGEASKFLQRAVNVADDGKIGPKTIAAVISAGSPLDVAGNVINQREQFYRNLAETKPAEAKFLSGWLNRLSDLRGAAGL